MSEREERMASIGPGAAAELPPPLPSVELPPPLPIVISVATPPAVPPPVPPGDWQRTSPSPPAVPVRIPESTRHPRARPGAKWIVFTLSLVLAVGGLVFWLVSRSEIAVVVSDLVVETPPTSVPKNLGLLRLDAIPWAAVTRIVDADGHEVALPASPYTPLTLQVPAGRYMAELTHPALGDEKRTCELEVSAAVPGKCQVEIFRIEANEYLVEAGWWK